MYVDLILNLSLLVAISAASGFIAQRWSRPSTGHALMQGLLFGGAALIGMLRPVVFSPGLLFDGRSVMVSLCALFFGPVAGVVAAVIAAVGRLRLGGTGALTGVLVIAVSAGIGVIAHMRRKSRQDTPSTSELYMFGVAVHLAMLAMMLTLPSGTREFVLRQVTIPVLMIFPIATLLAGRSWPSRNRRPASWRS